MSPLRWSYGTSRYDVRPTQHEGTLRALAVFVQQHRAESKARAGYLCGPLLPEATRCREGVAPRTWLAIDVDGIDADVHPTWRLWLTRFEGLGWPTASNAPERPRERVLITLDEAVGYADAVRIGELLLGDIAAEFGAAVVIDPSTFRGAQPCFLPLQGARLFYLLGDPVRSAEWLAQAPPPPAPPPPLDEAGAAVADANVRWVLEKLGEARMLIAPLPNGRGYAVRCPWEDEHSASTSASATAVLYPAEANGWRGWFSCLHSHCTGRTLAELHQVVRDAVAAEVAAC
jgi:hypothetical protein